MKLEGEYTPYICDRRRVFLDYEAIFHSCRVAEAPLRCPTNAVGSEYAIAGFHPKSVTTTGLDAVNRDAKCSFLRQNFDPK